VIKNCDGSAIANGGLNSDLLISGNVIENTNSVVPGAAIQLSDSARVLITGNNINGTVPAVAMIGNSDDWQISQNYFSNIGTAPVLLRGTGSVAGVFKLGIGETIAITYGTRIPTSAVFAE
jgi:hypothetical protein